MTFCRQPIAIFGGTFDPIHYGHLRLVYTLSNVLALEYLCLIPTGKPPHRATPSANSQDRLAMARLAIQGFPNVVVDDREVIRVGASYTVDTLTAYRQEIGNSHSLILVIGIDAAIHFASWHCWETILELAHLAVISRPGYLVETHVWPIKWRWNWHKRLVGTKNQLHSSPAGLIWQYQQFDCPISATEIRQRIAQNQSVDGLIPAAVMDYIRTHKLYQPRILD